MPATMLSYNTSHELISQNTYYNCGPGSSQLVLDARGIYVSEEELSVVLGTTVDGTPSVDCIANGLNHYDGESQYASMWMPNDPPTPDEVNLMRERIFRTIAWGRGCVANFVVPPANYPRAVPKSDPNLPGASGQSPGYAGGIVYHYVSILATDDTDDTVMIVDPGFQPSTYWVTVSQLASMVTPHGIVWASAAPPLPAAAPAPAPTMGETEALAFAMGNVLSNDRYRELLPAVKTMLRDADCTTPLRVAHLLAQVETESGGLMYQCELADGWAYEGRQDLHGPNMQPGDGPRFRGHGWLQCTGRVNHEQVSQWAFSKGLVPTSDYFVADPEALCSDQYSGMSVAWYFTVARPQLLSLCDADDLEGVTQAVNGGQHGIDSRRAALGRAKQVAEILMPKPEQLPPPVLPAPPEAPAAPKPHTPLTGRPHHHGSHESLRIPEGHEDILDQLLDVRAEGLITQRLVFELAVRAGIDAPKLYQETRDSF